MKHNKYIILVKDGNVEFRCGYVIRHAHLLNNSSEEKYVIGGGKFAFSDEDNAVILYGESDDYGYPKDIKENLKKCYDSAMIALGDEYYYHFKDDEEMPYDYRLVYTDPFGVTRDVKTEKVVLLKTRCYA
jgi:hypothetical protein